MMYYLSFYTLEWKANFMEAFDRFVQSSKWDAPGLTCLPKLKYEHTALTSFSKMRVDLAAQVYMYMHVCLYHYGHVYIAVCVNQ